MFLLHPSQPLSHVSRLIVASFPANTHLTTNVDFLSVSQKSSAREIRWSDSTDVGDFVKEAARDREFAISISTSPPKADTPKTNIPVIVPSFRSRTRFLRHRLKNVSEDRSRLEKVKRDCDYIAHRSARRLALGGFAMLLVYFGAVARLTFWDLGWWVTPNLCI